MALNRFTEGNAETVSMLNSMVDAVNSLLNLNGDIFIRAVNTPAGTTVRLNIDEVLLRIMKNNRGGGGGGGSGLRRAFVKTEPSSGNGLDVFLDADTTGTEVTVTCSIYDDDGVGATFANEVRPKVSDGCPLWVTYNAIDGEWQNVTSIFRVGDC